MATACCCSRFSASRTLFQQSLKCFLIRPPPAAILRCQFLATGAVPPKKPGNSFIQFSNETRANVKAENPGARLTDVSRKIGELWRNLPQKEKDIYAQRAKALEEEFQIELKEFRSSLSSFELEEIKEEKREKRRKRAKRQGKNLLNKLEKPKQPRQAFAYYLKSRKGDIQGFSKDILKELSADWKKLSDNEKEVFKQQSKEDTERYRKEIEEWEELMVMEGRSELIRKGTKNKLNKAEEGEAEESEEEEDSEDEDDSEEDDSV